MKTIVAKNSVYEQKMKAAFITLSDPAATDEDKEDAKKILDDIKRKVET